MKDNYVSSLLLKNLTIQKRKEQTDKKTKTKIIYSTPFDFMFLLDETRQFLLYERRYLLVLLFFGYMRLVHFFVT